MNALAVNLLTGVAPPELEAFSRFNGSWELEWRRPGDAEAPASLRGELHFGTVLGGRAIQDVWIVPIGGPASAEEGKYAFHGTTVRFFDNELGAWRSTWVEPIQGRVRTFIGRPDGDEMHLISTDGGPFLRWRFTEIGSQSFVWLGEYSVDEGRSWILEEKMVATRQKKRRVLKRGAAFTRFCTLHVRKIDAAGALKIFPRGAKSAGRAPKVGNS